MGKSRNRSRSPSSITASSSLSTINSSKAKYGNDQLQLLSLFFAIEPLPDLRPSIFADERSDEEDCSQESLESNNNNSNSNNLETDVNGKEEEELEPVVESQPEEPEQEEEEDEWWNDWDDGLDFDDYDSFDYDDSFDNKLYNFKEGTYLIAFFLFYNFLISYIDEMNI